MTITQEYLNFLKKNFKGLKLRVPLFYNWAYGIRFDLQVGSTASDDYFEEMTRRATTIFESAFNTSDDVFLILRDYKFRRRKIRFSNYAFKQLKNLKKADIGYSKESRVYNPNDYLDLTNLAIVKTTAGEINYSNLLMAIGHTDFWPRQPRLDDVGALSCKEIYFINITKNLIFNMYDDRGLDIIANDLETIRPIFTSHNAWILEYDREQIEKTFE